MNEGSPIDAAGVAELVGRSSTKRRKRNSFRYNYIALTSGEIRGLWAGEMLRGLNEGGRVACVKLGA